jgi:hypothetical protein
MPDIQFFPVPLGTFTASVIDNNGAPSKVVEAGLDFSVEGAIVLNAGNIITGTMTVTAYADEVGGPFDASIGSTPVTIPGDGTFPYKVTIPANKLANPPTSSGVYELTAVLTHTTSAGTLTNVTAFENLEQVRAN